ncbi:NUDIX domain-containing protein [Clostridium beijerinckii]|uniref:NUDIX hydrolase n=1 Tax=Clostridium beijerinckii TaxID=1520 RepID=UPI00156FC11A|nr:NUDIX domain-containing protein [Clostridium beijerinckii]NRT35863.1 mutator protein MutT [Clostridium beijerinckii]NRT44711.1 mutator protein MutT [Clostridium beijerinckii]NRZ21298.1 mutator protein MutT [Clostridium beijerinckii]UYZ38489.1 NUDIX domain-containing protein [Clostridium beijerinckii]
MDEYIKKLRKHIGNSPLLLVAAGAIIYKNRKILLQRRADSGKWAIHGGVLELGETVEETVKRELNEEIGINPIKLKFYKVFSGEDMHTVYPNGDEVYYINVIFLCDKYEGELKEDNNEGTELKWFDVDNLPVDINAPVDKAILSDIEKVLS